jgi:hypothetical protein
MEAGEWKKHRKLEAHRQWRERKDHFGEMLQMNHSHRDWLEGRGPKCLLRAFIDDATDTVYARFKGYEGAAPARDTSRRMIYR